MTFCNDNRRERTSENGPYRQITQTQNLTTMSAHPSITKARRAIPAGLLVMAPVMSFLSTGPDGYSSTTCRTRSPYRSGTGSLTRNSSYHFRNAEMKTIAISTIRMTDKTARRVRPFGR